MSEPMLMILPDKRRPGRPRAPEPRSTLSSWIPTTHHDTLIQLANARGVSVSKFVQMLVAREVKRP